MISDRTPQQALAALLDRYAPQRLLLVGAGRIPAVEAFQQAHPNCEVAHADAGALPADLAAQRYDLALLADCLEHLDRRTTLQLVGGIRNLNSSRVAVLVDLPAAGVAETDFYALGMQASERFQRGEQTLTLLTYDLREYKQVPDWLNAKFWANPENFGKYWW
ncbi:DUF6231 family protein [Pseudomonas panipatensis]|uniref:Uncharacterized protein n=1 Tax=Pseudomonas panipatensis TaxID=428992 RepID=A0A1G8BR82_9PSED|nr:DUF6231 family protein [Pseudomonas panipatensis]SDH35702.1 hypothetical protein SAMN05216272_101188 [Pseudomonas panipatensis]SMP71725.1 hypothetical protein SAMN06295951_110169 [Pseudomonas panipatensis]